MLQVVSPAEAAVNSQLGVVAAAQAGGAGVGGYHGAPANKLQRSDRIEVRKQNYNHIYCFKYILIVLSRVSNFSTPSLQYIFHTIYREFLN